MSHSTKTYLVTGGAGFIGSHLCEALLKSGNRVIAVDNLSTGSLDNIAALENHPNFHFARAVIENDVVLDRLTSQVDAVVHLAAAVGVKLIVERPVQTIETNIGGTEKVLQAALPIRVSRADCQHIRSLRKGQQDSPSPRRMTSSLDRPVGVGGRTRRARWWTSSLGSRMVGEYGLPVVVFTPLQHRPAATNRPLRHGHPEICRPGAERRAGHGLRRRNSKPAAFATWRMLSGPSSGWPNTPIPQGGSSMWVALRASALGLWPSASGRWLTAAPTSFMCRTKRRTLRGSRTWSAAKPTVLGFATSSGGNPPSPWRRVSNARRTTVVSSSPSGSLRSCRRLSPHSPPAAASFEPEPLLLEAGPRRAPERRLMLKSRSYFPPTSRMPTGAVTSPRPTSDLFARRFSPSGALGLSPIEGFDVRADVLGRGVVDTSAVDAVQSTLAAQVAGSVQPERRPITVAWHYGWYNDLTRPEGAQTVRFKGGNYSSRDPVVETMFNNQKNEFGITVDALSWIPVRANNNAVDNYRRGLLRTPNLPTRHLALLYESTLALPLGGGRIDFSDSVGSRSHARGLRADGSVSRGGTETGLAAACLRWMDGLSCLSSGRTPGVCCPSYQGVSARSRSPSTWHGKRSGPAMGTSPFIVGEEVLLSADGVFAEDRARRMLSFGCDLRVSPCAR